MNTIYRSNIYSEFFLILYILGSTLLSVTYTTVGMIPPPWLRSCLLYVLLFGIPSFAFMRYCGMTPRSIGLVRPASTRSVIYTLLMAFLIQAPLMLLSSISELLFHNYLEDSISSMLAQPLPLLLLGTAVCPAIFEEITCRGIFLSGYRRTRPLTSALLCGVFFGILHLNMQQWVYAFFFGFVIALWMLAVDSLWLPMLAHFIINGTQLICSYYGIALFPNLLTVVLANLISLPCIYLMLQDLWRRRQISDEPETFEPLTRPLMKPFLITIVIFLVTLLLL